MLTPPSFWRAIERRQAREAKKIERAELRHLRSRADKAAKDSIASFNRLARSLPSVRDSLDYLQAN